MNIYILTEISKRELDSNILLALVAAQNGSSVLISNMDTIEYLANNKLITKVFSIRKAYYMMKNKIFTLICIILVLKLPV